MFYTWSYVKACLFRIFIQEQLIGQEKTVAYCQSSFLTSLSRGRRRNAAEALNLGKRIHIL